MTISENDPAKLAKTFENLSLSKQPNLWKKLKHLEIPTLLVSGSLDEKYVAINSRAAQILPTCTQKFIEDAGHNTHFEKPKKFTSVVVNYLKKMHQVKYNLGQF